MSNAEEFRAVVEPISKHRRRGSGSLRRRARRIADAAAASKVRPAASAIDPGGAAQLRAELIASEQARIALQDQLATLEGTFARAVAKHIEEIAAARNARLALEVQNRSLTAQLSSAERNSDTTAAAAVQVALHKQAGDHLASIRALEQQHRARIDSDRRELLQLRTDLQELSSRKRQQEEDLSNDNRRLKEECARLREGRRLFQDKFEHAKSIADKWKADATQNYAKLQAARLEVELLRSTPATCVDQL